MLCFILLYAILLISDPRKNEGEDRGDYFGVRSQRAGSEDVWSASANSSITDVSNMDGSKDDGKNNKNIVLPGDLKSYSVCKQSSRLHVVK